MQAQSLIARFISTSFVDCCLDKEKDVPVAIGDTFKEQCSTGSRKTSEKKCHLSPREGPTWLYSSRCPPNPTKEALKGLDRVRIVQRLFKSNTVDMLQTYHHFHGFFHVFAM